MNLVGREAPAAAVRSEIERTLHSHGGLAFVTGEAGIGKSALVAEAVACEGRPTARVACGSCREGEGRPAYWPWAQVARTLLREVDADEPPGTPSGDGHDLVRLLDDESAPPDGAVAGPLDLGDAIAGLLVQLARQRPVVVILEDLHWADPASLRLLDHVASHTWFEQVLLLGTYRDVEVEPAGHPLRSLLLPLAARARTIRLTGLDVAAVETLLARSTGTGDAAHLAEEVHRRTGGNPFFVEQLARLWRSQGSVDTTTPGIRDVIERRLDLVDDEVRDLLTLAAVIGAEQPRHLLAAGSGRTLRALDQLAGEATAAGLMTVRQPGNWAFTHDLVRQTLYEGLDETEARRRHASIAASLAQEHDAMSPDAAAVRAHHAYMAVPEIAPEQAVEALQEATTRAVARFALDEAADHLRKIIDLAPVDRPADRVVPAIQLMASHFVLSDIHSCLQVLSGLPASVRDDHDPFPFAVAASFGWGLTWLADIGRGSEEDVNAQVRHAHTRLFGEPGPATAPDQRAYELSARVIELARAQENDTLLAAALVARHCCVWEHGRAPEREDLADELTALGHRTGNQHALLWAAALHFPARIEQGDPFWRATRISPDETPDEEAAERPLSPFERTLRVVGATTEGRFDAAAALLERGGLHSRPGPDRQDVLFQTKRHHQRWTLALTRGRFDEAEDLAARAREVRHPEPDLLLALTAVQRGDPGPGRAWLDRAPDRPTRRTRWFVPLALRLRAQVAAATGDSYLADELRKELAPLNGQWAVVFWDAPHGPWSYWLALLDAGEERWDAAVTGFTAADRDARRIGAVPWSIEARAQLVVALRQRDARGDRPRAVALAEEVEADARRTGMEHIVGRFAGPGDRAGHREDSPHARGQATHVADPPRREEQETAAFRPDGKVWVLAFDGDTVYLPEAKGLRDIHTLLRRPGHPLRAVDLVDPAGQELSRAGRSLGGDPVLDDQACDAYRQRLAALDEQIDTALHRGHDQRAAVLDRERAALVEELRRATGLGGRARRLGDEAERARKTVTARVRDTLRRIDREHPVLAEHLRASISTGSTCCYQPLTSVDWSL